MLQSTDPERLDNKKSSCRDAQISLGREIRRDFVSELRADGDRIMSDHGQRGRVPKETPGSGSISGTGKNLAQGNITR